MGAIFEIKNKFLSVLIHSKGAELMSIKSLKDDLEYLWQGNPEFWGGRSPLLFPVVGLLKGNKYTYDSAEYQMGRHGFARTSEFQLTEKSHDRITFKLEANEATLEIYPFNFELLTSYILSDNTLRISHRVINTGKGEMWFSIGEHPGFNCPLFPGETMEDYELEFDKKEYIERLVVEDGMLNGKKELFLNNEKNVKLSEDLFKDTLTVVLKGLESKSVSLIGKNHSRSITVDFDGYPYLAVWSPDTGAPLVCIEPWYGVAPRKDGSSRLEEKEGIIKLKAGGEFQCGYSITLD